MKKESDVLEKQKKEKKFKEDKNPFIESTLTEARKFRNVNLPPWLKSTADNKK